MTRTADTYWRRFLGKPRRGAWAGPLALIDVGSSKLCCYVTQSQGNRGFNLVSRGYQAAEGFRAGAVVEPQDALESILAVVHEAEQKANEQLRDIAVVWSGGAPETRLVAIDRSLAGRQVTTDDINWMLQTARAEAAADGRAVLHVAAVDAELADGRSVRDPIGVAADAITLNMTVTTVDADDLAVLLDVIGKAHLDVRHVFATPYAAGLACLSADEARRGCFLLEMGGGATSLALFQSERMIHMDQVPYGGDHVSRDVSIGLKTSRAYGERLKTLYGSVQQRSCDDNMWIDVPIVGDALEQPSTEVPRSRLTMIARLRVQETLTLLRERIDHAVPLLRARPPRDVVMTGGACQIDGMVELVEEIFGLPTRMGGQEIVRDHVGFETQPCCSAASGGLVLATCDDGGLVWTEVRERTGWNGGLARVQRWLRENFAD